MRTAVTRWVGVVVIMLCLGACVEYRPYTPPTYYYVSPATIYLRDCPGYECGIVAQLYNGDQVEKLDVNDYGWWRVRAVRTGQIGWMPGEQLSLAPVPSVYYVSLPTALLRTCPDYKCPSLGVLQRGDRVEKLDQNEYGWWQVRVLKDSRTGWIPATAVALTPGPPLFYVAVENLNLRMLPSTSSRIITVLNLNDKVEKLDQNPSGWFQVRRLRDGAVGWVAARYLEYFPVSYPRKPPRPLPPPAKKPITPKVKPQEKKELPTSPPVRPRPM